MGGLRYEVGWENPNNLEEKGEMEGRWLSTGDSSGSAAILSVPNKEWNRLPISSVTRNDVEHGSVEGEEPERLQPARIRYDLWGPPHIPPNKFYTLFQLFSTFPLVRLLICSELFC